MCAKIFLKAKVKQIAERFGASISEQLELDEIDQYIHGYLKIETSPVIVFSEGRFQLRKMCFSLCPSWSKDFPCKWSTYNARLEREKAYPQSKGGVSEWIYEVPTWKIPFTRGQTCLVPISGAVESSYFGSQAGNIVRFSVKDQDVFYALGIWSEWTNPESGEIKETYALITDDPYEFFFEAGHDRSIIVIDDLQAEKWLKDSKMTPQKRVEFIRESRVNQNWSVEVERPMKAGWEKRAPSKEEISRMTTWKE